MNAPMPWWKALGHVLDKDAGLPVKLVAFLAILYAVFPLDAMPDVVPFFGWADDALVLVGSALYVVRMVRSRFVKKP